MMKRRFVPFHLRLYWLKLLYYSSHRHIQCSAATRLQCLQNGGMFHVPFQVGKTYSCTYLPNTTSPFSRKELMHMLHTRRKAEIEIISTAKSFRPLFEFPSMTGMDGQALH